MKSTYKLIKKGIILITIIILNIVIYKIYHYCEEKAFIKYCVESCCKDIYNYMIQDDSARYYGYYNVYLGKESGLLISKFYNECIINKEYIKTYVTTLDWYSILINNKKDIVTIINIVRENYIEYIKLEENMYTSNLLKNTTLEETRKTLFIFLQNYITMLNIFTESDIKFIINKLIPQIIEKMDCNLYIRTFEFQNKDYSTLINMLDSIINDYLIQKDNYYDNLRKILESARNTYVFILGWYNIYKYSKLIHNTVYFANSDTFILFIKTLKNFFIRRYW